MNAEIGSPVMRRVGRIRAGIHDHEYDPGHVRRRPSAPKCQHGTTAAYAAGCHCSECKAAVAEAKAKTRARAKAIG